MKNLVLVARVLFGLLFAVFGANFFYPMSFLLQPDLSPEGAALMTAFSDSGYMLPLIKGTELTAGVLLLLGQFVPFALIVLAPITVNIVAFHAYLEPNGLPVAIVVVVLHLFLTAAYGQAFGQVMKRVPAERR